MGSHELHLELLLGRRVKDRDGKLVGRIEEVIAERENLECTVREFHVGPHALLERLSMGFVRAFRGPGQGATAIAWDKLDLSDPAHPRLTCRMADL